MGLKKSELLNARETFEHYEANRSRPGSQNMSFDSIPQHNPGRSPVLACEYRTQPPPQLACEYSSQHGDGDNRPYLSPVAEQIQKFKIPFGWIVCIAITIPIFILIILFGAVWFQELGWLGSAGYGG